jgi:hypothetical protein
MAAYVNAVMNVLWYKTEFLDHHIVNMGCAVGNILSQLLSKR